MAGIALASLLPMVALPDSPAADAAAGAAGAAAPVPAPPLALFSKAAARAEALGPLEALMMAAALPVAAFALDTGAVEEDTGRW